MIKDGLGFPIACFEDRECFGSNSGTKVYAEAYKQWWLEWLKLPRMACVISCWLYHLGFRLDQ